MFILTTITDLVQIIPEDFRKRSAEAIEDNLNAKYSNKVIQRSGLGICVYDLISVSEGHIGHNSGIVNANVEFRLVVFRPFKGEIITGRISSASEWGMKVRLDFFDDIHIPPHMLFDGSYFNVKEQSWIWQNEGADYFYDKNDWVRVRVEGEEWHDISPAMPYDSEDVATLERQSPYSIKASMMQPGLGPVVWWSDVQ